MSVTYGFYNSVSGDRKYNADQMSAIFNYLITDGVLESMGSQYRVDPGTGRQILVQPGWAWFDSTWTLNDSALPLAIPTPDISYARIDAVVIETDKSTDKRMNSIKLVVGTPSANPVKPTLANTALVKQHPIAYVKVRAATTSIASGDIERMVGKSQCPFITGILQTVSVQSLFNQWESEWNTFKSTSQTQFNNAQAQRTADFNTAQTSRDTAFTQAQNQRASDFTAAQTQRANDFNSAQSARNTQWTAWFNATEEEWDTWFEHITLVLSEDVVANLQLQIDQNTGDIESLQTSLGQTNTNVTNLQNEKLNKNASVVYSGTQITPLNNSDKYVVPQYLNVFSPFVMQNVIAVTSSATILTKPRINQGNFFALGIGGGGGGGGARRALGYTCGGGGGGGSGFLNSFYYKSASSNQTTISVIIGSGGEGNATGNGYNGTPSKVGSVICDNGRGGTIPTSSGTGGAGGSGFASGGGGGGYSGPGGGGSTSFGGGEGGYGGNRLSGGRGGGSEFSNGGDSGQSGNSVYCIPISPIMIPNIYPITGISQISGYNNPGGAAGSGGTYAGGGGGGGIGGASGGKGGYNNVSNGGGGGGGGGGYGGTSPGGQGGYVDNNISAGAGGGGGGGYGGKGGAGGSILSAYPGGAGGGGGGGYSGTAGSGCNTNGSKNDANGYGAGGGGGDGFSLNTPGNGTSGLMLISMGINSIKGYSV